MNANQLGFSKGNSGEQNTRILNQTIKEHREVSIEEPGVYDLTGPILLPSHCHLHFGPGVTIRRCEASDNRNGNLFINEGAFTHQYNDDIELDGLHLITNGVQHTRANTEWNGTILGLRGHISFLYIKHLHISNFLVTDLSTQDYAIQVSDFEDVLLEHIHAEGLKDGIHLGPGKKFIVRNCCFRTMDDDIAINCSDYSVSNPNIGSIEDGLIENIVDLPDVRTESLFLRILVGTPRPWKKGMTVYHSDAIVSQGRMYRVVMHTDNVGYESTTPPTFEEGFHVLDGICWVRTNPTQTGGDLLRPVTCRNVCVRNVSLERERHFAVMIYSDDSEFLHSYYPATPVPIVSNICFENVQVHNKVEFLMSIEVPVENIEMKNVELEKGQIKVRHNSRMGDYDDILPIHTDREVHYYREMN